MFILAGSVTTIKILVFLTPVAYFWFANVSALPPELASYARNAFLIAIPMAALTIFQSWFQGTIVNGGKTKAIPEATGIFVGIFFLIAVVGIAYGKIPGLYMGMARFLTGESWAGGLAGFSQSKIDGRVTQERRGMKMKPMFTKLAWGSLFYNMLVILWGAFVRATGSGAGCGSHWPFCNGEVIPQAPQIETIIEFIHRVSSGLVIVPALVLFVWAWQKTPKKSFLRRSTAGIVFFTLTEALVGAGLVLFHLTGTDDSITRAVVIVIHLLNTFLASGLPGSHGLVGNLW